MSSTAMVIASSRTAGKFDWSPQQLIALERARQWLRSGSTRPFLLFGVAGSGKSTLIAEITKDLGAVAFLAPTGKAAAVLRRKGCADARTIHSTVYIPPAELAKKAKDLRADIELQTAQGAAPAVLDGMQERLQDIRSRLRNPRWTLRGRLDPDADLLVLDEASMVGKRIAEDMLSFDKPLLVMGDPAQLPPVRDNGYFMRMVPDVFLDEVHRQALESYVLRMATQVRTNGADSLPFDEHHVRIGDIGGREFTRLALEADQVLVGYRKTTLPKVNAMMREALGFGSQPMPQPGEKIVCRRNRKIELPNGLEFQLLNGTLWRVLECDDLVFSYRARITPWDAEDGTEEVEVHMHAQPFAGQEVAHEEDVEDRCKFEHGRALTVHSAQGSQWRNVVLVDDWRGKDRRAWIYTGITRAEEGVTVVRASR